MVVMASSVAERADQARVGSEGAVLSFGVLDRWTLAYLAFVSVVLATRWHLPLPHRELLVLAHLLILAVVLLAARVRAHRPGSALADWYALFLLPPVYSELGILNATQGISHDLLVQSWDAALFGGQPSFDWIRALPSPTVSTVLHLAYLSYYFIVLGTPLGLWLSGRRQGARESIIRIMAAFYVCYVIFLLFPVAGPRYLFPLAQNAATAVPVARFTQDLLNGGAAWGTAFPSSHVAVTLVAALCGWLSWRAFGAVLLVGASLLTAATVYGQFHYAIDAIAGLVVGAFMAWVPVGIPRARGERPL
jgi:membrane-associated phospholipid phosphatase